MTPTPIMLNPAPTTQELFDAAITHLAGMTERCEEDGACLYRSDDNTTACPVGALMTDEECGIGGSGRYLSGGIKSLNTGKPPERLVPHLDLLQAVQLVHDTAQNWVRGEDGTRGAPQAWSMRIELMRITKRFGLSPSVLYAAFPNNAVAA